MDPCDRRLRRIEHVARLLDSQFRIPGTGVRIGLDGLLGLIPGAGDAAAALAACYLIYLAKQLGAPRWLLARMVLNVGIDSALGTVPLIGDVFDVAFKANRRNAELLKRYLAKRNGTTGTGQTAMP